MQATAKCVFILSKSLVLGFLKHIFLVAEFLKNHATRRALLFCLLLVGDFVTVVLSIKYLSVVFVVLVLIVVFNRPHKT